VLQEPNPLEESKLDENGACKFPSDKLEQVLINVRMLKKEEQDRMGQVQKATTAAKLKDILQIHSYSEKECM
jgi:4-hydroxy-4-methyl-2-oxoglutarate aldolase